MSGSVSVHAAEIIWESTELGGPKPDPSFHSILIIPISHEKYPFFTRLVHHNSILDGSPNLRIPDVKYRYLKELVNHSSLIQDGSPDSTLLRVECSFHYQNQYYVCFPRVSKGSLRSLSMRQFPQGFPENVIIEVLHSILKALSIVHNNRLVHKGLSAGHVFIDSEGCLKLGYKATMFAFLEDSRVSRLCLDTFYYEDKPMKAPFDIELLGILALELAYGSSALLYKDDADGNTIVCTKALDSLVGVIHKTKKLPKNLEICGVYTDTESRVFSKEFEKLVVECLATNDGKRPLAYKLLNKKIFANRREGDSQFFYNLIHSREGLPEDVSIIYDKEAAKGKFVETSQSQPSEDVPGTCVRSIHQEETTPIEDYNSWNYWKLPLPIMDERGGPNSSSGEIIVPGQKEEEEALNEDYNSLNYWKLPLPIMDD